MAKKSRKQAAKDIGKNLISGFKSNLKGMQQGISAVSQLASGKPISAVKSAVNATKSSIKGDKAGRSILKDIGTLLFNHPEWYQNYPLDGLVNLNFGRRKGLYDLKTDVDDSGMLCSIPSVASIDIMLTMPMNETYDFYQAINYLYSTIRSANSGSVNYSPESLAKYVIDVRNLHAAYADLRRAYSILNDVRINDSLSPAIYMAAIGKDYKTFSANSANLREYGNKLSIQISKLVPLDLDIINRTRWMFSNFFLDSDDAKASCYCFTVQTLIDSTGESYYINSIGPSSRATGLEFNAYMTAIQNLVAKVVGNQTYMVIAGDILKTFGESAIYPSEIFGDNMTVPFIYDEAALTQIQNATLSFAGNGTLGSVSTTYGLSEIPFGSGLPFEGWPAYIYRQAITQSSNPELFATLTRGITSDTNEFSDTIFNTLSTQFVNAYKDSISPGEVISFTRLKTFYDIQYTTGSSIALSAKSYGTEIAGSMYVFNAESDSGNYLHIVGTPISWLMNMNHKTNKRRGLLAWTTMDWAPLVVPYYTKDNNGLVEPAYGAPLWDFNNYARMTMDNAQTFHGYAVMSLLASDRIVRQSAGTVINDSKGIVGK